MSKKNDYPLISVVVPIYKVEDYLPECIESIITQKYENLEIILVDDGSPDKCPSMCDDYKKKDERIKVVHKKNGGLSDARNAGINVATGKYICFIDSDDYVAPDYVSKLYAALDKNNADMSVCGYEMVYDDGEKETDETPKEEVLNENQYWQKVYSEMFTTFVVAWNKLYRTDIFAEARYTKGKNNEDQIILHKVLEKCHKIAVISDSLYFYRKRRGSITDNDGKKQLSDDAYGGLVDRANYFLEKKKYELCATQLYALLGETKDRKQAKKYSKKMVAIAKNIPDKYKSRDFKLKMSVLRFAPGAYGLKKLR